MHLTTDTDRCHITRVRRRHGYAIKGFAVFSRPGSFCGSHLSSRSNDALADALVRAVAQTTYGCASLPLR